MKQKELIIIALKIFGLYTGTIAINSIIQLFSFIATPVYNGDQEYQTIMLVSILIKVAIYLGFSILLVLRTEIVLAKISKENPINNENIDSSITPNKEKRNSDDIVFWS